MARCMLCSTPAGPGDVVCARCGGALEHDGGDDVTRVQGVELGKAAEPSPAETAWPGEGGPPADPYAPPGGYGYSPPLAPGPYGPMGPPPGVGPHGLPPGPPPGPGPYAYGPPPGAYGYGSPGWAPPPRQEGMALAGFITSLLGVLLAGVCLVPILACPVGAVLGHVALRRIEREGTAGRGFALAAVIIGWIGTAILVIGTIAIVGIAFASGGSG